MKLLVTGVGECQPPSLWPRGKGSMSSVREAGRRESAGGVREEKSSVRRDGV